MQISLSLTEPLLHHNKLSGKLTRNTISYTYFGLPVHTVTQSPATFLPITTELDRTVELHDNNCKPSNCGYYFLAVSAADCNDKSNFHLTTFLSHQTVVDVVDEVGLYKSI